MTHQTNSISTSLQSAAELRARLQGRRSVMLYGAGTVGRDSLAVLQRAGVLVNCFLDAKTLSFSSIEGTPVRKPDDPAFDAEVRAQTTVIVTIFNTYLDMPALHRRLADLGWSDVVMFTSFYEAFFAELGNRYWLTNRDYYRNLEHQVAAARSLWADEKSRSVFDGIMRFRLTGDYDTLNPADLEAQYFPKDLQAWPAPLRMIDCGAYDGDTFRQISSLGLELDSYVGFEPDAANFAKLVMEIVKPDLKKPVNAALWPCGAWSHCCQLRFASGNGSGSAVSGQGDCVIQCVSIDEALPVFRPNLIKMDIEGAEYPALLGAARTIREHRPGLAICLYHEPAHLWQIPLLIADWNLGYRFYLRCHCYNGFELVLYAFPF